MGARATDGGQNGDFNYFNLGAGEGRSWDNVYYGRTPSFRGKLDEVRIYNRALSSNEIASLYTATAPQPTTHTITLRPGAHGNIVGANSGSNHVITVTNGAAFPAVAVTANAGWTFTGWNPPAPATVASNFEATATYLQGVSIMDDFNDGVLNTSIWTTALPYSDSIAREESSGYFHLGGLGSLITKAEFNPATAPISIAVRLSITSASDGTYFMTRSERAVAQNGIMFNSGCAYNA